MTDEPRFTLDEARAELARRKCFTDGHDYGVVSTGPQLLGGGDEPLHVECERCGTYWPCRGGKDISPAPHARTEPTDGGTNGP